MNAWKTRKTLAAVVAAAALSAVIAGPVSAAPPTLYGFVTCDAYGQQDREMSIESYWTKKAIAEFKRNEPAMDDCVKGSIGFLDVEPPA